jgi:phage replication-related protein YjqB (UPF0714/DUF867 family)
MKTLPLLFAALLCCACGTPARHGADVYKDFAELKAANTAGLEYSTEIYDRGSGVTVLAVHGGDLENFTSALARQVAGKDLNLYLFNGWLGRESRRLHITSTHFNDPEAVRLAKASVLGVAVHAQAERGEWVCVGGRNEEAARLMTGILEAEGFSAETPCARLPGTSERNIVNLPSSGGVQLEITVRLLRRLARNPGELLKFSRAVRMAAELYMERTQQERKK